MYMARESTYSNAYRNVYIYGICIIYDVMYNKKYSWHCRIAVTTKSIRSDCNGANYEIEYERSNSRHV